MCQVATPRVLKPGEERLIRLYLRLAADALLLRSAGLLHQLAQLRVPTGVACMTQKRLCCTSEVTTDKASLPLSVCPRRGAARKTRASGAAQQRIQS